MSTGPLIAHAVVAALIIVGYIVLTALGDDGTPLLAALGAYGLGGGVQAATAKASG